MGKRTKPQQKKHKPTEESIQHNIELISKPPLRRLARRGGAKRMTILAYMAMRETIKNSLTETVEKTALVTRSEDRTTIILDDVIFALQSKGDKTYA